MKEFTLETFDKLISELEDLPPYVTSFTVSWNTARVIDGACQQPLRPNDRPPQYRDVYVVVNDYAPDDKIVATMSDGTIEVLSL